MSTPTTGRAVFVQVVQELAGLTEAEAEQFTAAMEEANGPCPVEPKPFDPEMVRNTLLAGLRQVIRPGNTREILNRL